jgi:hypothetical protein
VCLQNVQGPVLVQVWQMCNLQLSRLVVGMSRAMHPV